MQGGGPCQHRPQGLVAASSAPASLLGLMNASGHAQTVSACVATLNNLCASEEGADRVFEEAKRFAPHVSSVHSRTEQYPQWYLEALDTHSAPTAPMVFLLDLVTKLCPANACRGLKE